MDHAASPSLAEELAAARDWWREAGVDCVFSDEPVEWLNVPAVSAAPPVAAMPAPVERPIEPGPAAPAIGGDASLWPADPAGFAQWWLAEPALDIGGAMPRIPPRGAAGAQVMVLVPQPEAEDREQLLSGPQGRLLATFLNAAGLAEENTYLAAALPRHMPHPDWPALAQAGLGRIMLHHAAIVRPQRILLFGSDVLALVGNNPAQKPAFSLDLNQQDGSVPALAARSLEHMLNIPSARSRFWRDWLDWTDG